MIQNIKVRNRGLWSLPVAVALLHGCGARVPDNAYQSPPPPEVSVAAPLQLTVTQFIEENGETEVVERAEVRGRVRGFLNAINFEPGQLVSKGDVLYEIQRDEYEATVNSAQASLTSAEAAIDVAEAQVGVAQVELSRARKEFVRYEGLLAQEATTQKQFDQAQADLDAAKANVTSAESTVKAAQAERGRAAADLAAHITTGPVATPALRRRLTGLSPRPRSRSAT